MPTLKDLIDELELESQTPDSLFRVKTRFMMTKYFKEALKKLNLTFGRSIVGMNGTIPSSCKLYKPQDYLRFIRAYIINCDGKTIELAKDSTLPETIFNFLIDCDGSILTDCDGTDLYQECISCNSVDNKIKDTSCEVCCGKGKYVPEPLRSLLDDLVKYSNSTISVRDEYFEFSADLEEQNVIIEYVSNKINDIDECAINIPDEYEDALVYYTKYKLLEGGQDTLNISQAFKKEYKSARNVLSKSQNGLSMADIDSILLMKSR
ncbi:hypothetical protein CMU94_02035 [Elizabethkingia anophelis]|nr:hypothetical protein [Elizabethkingia anophelis]